jgi:hypothetical protein
MAGANDPWPLWAQEASGTSGAPTMTRLLVAGALVAALALTAQSGQPATHSGRNQERATDSPACAEAARLRVHGATSSPSYARVRAACARSRQP